MSEVPIDPDGIPFPEPTTAEREALAWKPGASDDPTGLELLKLWVHQYEAGQRPYFSDSMLRDIAAVVGVWEAEREVAALAVTSAKGKADLAQSRCDAAQERVEKLTSERSSAWRVAAGANAANRSLEVSVQRLRERIGDLEAAKERQAQTIVQYQMEKRERRAAGAESEPERLVVLSSGSVEKIADQVLDRFTEEGVTDEIAREVASRLIERAATPAIRAAVASLQAGTAGAASILRGAGE